MVILIRYMNILSSSDLLLRQHRMERGKLGKGKFLGAHPVYVEGAGAPARPPPGPPKKGHFWALQTPLPRAEIRPPGAPGEAPENPGFLCPKRGPPREFSKQPTVLAYY